MIWVSFYLVVGLGLGIYDWHQHSDSLGRRLLNLLLYVSLWPLWAPIVLLGKAGVEEPEQNGSSARISEALREAATIVVECNLHSLLPARVVTEVCGSARNLENHRKELLAAVQREARSLDEQSKPSPIRIANLNRLHSLCQHHEQALSSLEGLAESLRVQLLLVRHSGASTDGVSQLIEELASSVESLGAWISLDQAASRSGLGNPQNVPTGPGAKRAGA